MTLMTADGRPRRFGGARPTETDGTAVTTPTRHRLPYADALLAVLLTLTAILVTQLGRHDGRPLDLLGWTLLLTAHAPTVWRRTAPMRSFVALIALLVPYHALGYHHSALMAVSMVALYTVAATQTVPRPPRGRRSDRRGPYRQVRAGPDRGRRGATGVRLDRGLPGARGLRALPPAEHGGGRRAGRTRRALPRGGGAAPPRRGEAAHRPRSARSAGPQHHPRRCPHLRRRAPAGQRPRTSGPGRRGPVPRRHRGDLPLGPRGAAHHARGPAPRPGGRPCPAAGPGRAARPGGHDPCLGRPRDPGPARGAGRARRRGRGHLPHRPGVPDQRRAARRPAPLHPGPGPRGGGRPARRGDEPLHRAAAALVASPWLRTHRSTGTGAQRGRHAVGRARLRSRLRGPRAAAAHPGGLGCPALAPVAAAGASGTEEGIR